MKGKPSGEKKRGNKKGDVKRGMKVIFWNVAGLRNKDKSFWDFVRKFDVVGLTETFRRKGQ